VKSIKGDLMSKNTIGTIIGIITFLAANMLAGFIFASL